ncbi:hypothetical protein GCM10023340_09400 [Nocardioides marinquilinus]|uniref:Phosphatidic acid phosphatase type 2/haloperoxidase domain-containing protein n=1 Tax=Nocardioides marinquilinus TaxID=1210400 RepID=A0ABP9PBB1_9ACTN
MAPVPRPAGHLVTAVTGLAVAFVVLAVAVGAGWTHGLDGAGRPMASWAAGHGLHPFLRDVEVGFALPAMTVCTLVVALALVVVREVRAAVQVAVAVPVTSLVTGVLKTLVARPRPPWQWTGHELHSAAFPSGHASSAAALGVSIVLVVVALADGGRVTRRAASVAAAHVAVLVLLVGADRVLLGRHYPSDVLGGVLLGSGVALGVALVLAGPPGLTWRREARSSPSSTSDRR